MARVAFTPNLHRHVACPDVEVGGATVRAVLEPCSRPTCRWQTVSTHLPPIHAVRFVPVS